MSVHGWLWLKRTTRQPAKHEDDVPVPQKRRSKQQAGQNVARVKSGNLYHSWKGTGPVSSPKTGKSKSGGRYNLQHPHLNLQWGCLRQAQVCPLPSHEKLCTALRCLRNQFRNTPMTQAKNLTSSTLPCVTATEVLVIVWKMCCSGTPTG